MIGIYQNALLVRAWLGPDSATGQAKDAVRVIKSIAAFFENGSSLGIDEFTLFQFLDTVDDQSWNSLGWFFSHSW